MQTARKLDYYQDWQPKALPPEPAALPRREVVEKKKNKAVNGQAIFCITLVFFAMILLLVRYSDLAEHKVNVFRLKSEVKKLELTRDELTASLDENMDLAYIEKTAVDKLGMQRPGQTQIVYIEKTNLYSLKEPKGASASKGENPMQHFAKSVSWFAGKIHAANPSE